MRRTPLMSMWAGLLGVVAGGSAGAADGEAAALSVIDEWITAFDARDAARVAALYAPDAVFWGTASTTLRTSPNEVLAYFTESTTKRPRLRMRLGERHVRMLGDAASVSGYYTAIDPQEGGDVATPLRFTFVLAKRGDAWTIVSHHSSRMP